MSKQPIEGLTVRIFDDPSTPETKGRRGYRQYTEQVGSTEIKHTTHNWDDTTKGAENQGLKKSTRDWDADTKAKQSQDKVQDLLLVSRSDDNEKQSLKNVILQRGLWDYIVKEVAKVTDVYDKKAWDVIVDQLRKLREGIYASHWSQGDYAFAIEAYELSVDCSIKASRYEELAKCLSGLIDSLYTMEKVNTPHRSYYTVLDILFNCCYLQNIRKANQRLMNLSPSTNEGRFGHQFMRCYIRQNPIVFWHLYHHNPYPTFKLLMDCYAITMRERAIDVLRKSYLSTSIAWVGRWLGMYHDNGLVLAELDKLVKPSCIKQVDYERQLVYFLKKKNIAE